MNDNEKGLTTPVILLVVVVVALVAVIAVLALSGGGSDEVSCDELAEQRINLPQRCL